MTFHSDEGESYFELEPNLVRNCTREFVDPHMKNQRPEIVSPGRRPDGPLIWRERREKKHWDEAPKVQLDGRWRNSGNNIIC